MDTRRLKLTLRAVQHLSCSCGSAGQKISERGVYGVLEIDDNLGLPSSSEKKTGQGKTHKSTLSQLGARWRSDLCACYGSHYQSLSVQGKWRGNPEPLRLRQLERTSELDPLSDPVPLEPNKGVKGGTVAAPSNSTSSGVKPEMGLMMGPGYACTLGLCAPSANKQQATTLRVSPLIFDGDNGNAKCAASLVEPREMVWLVWSVMRDCVTA